MSTLTQAPEKERVLDRKAQKAQAGSLERPKKGRAVSNEMPHQLESPLNATINQREPLPLDALPAQQLESPLYATINQRKQATLAQLEAQELEYPLHAAINQRPQQPFADLPAQKESPLNAAINGHAEQKTWRKSKQ